jgi:hypothetical protein
LSIGNRVVNRNTGPCHQDLTFLYGRQAVTSTHSNILESGRSIRTQNGGVID